MKWSTPIQLIFLLTSIIRFSEISANESANEIVKKADLKRGLGNVSHSFSVTVTDQDNKIEKFFVSFKDVNNTVTEQTVPERARGRKLLMKDYDIWLFSPNIKKALRISLEQKLTGQVSNGDIARTNYSEDYDATFIDSSKAINDGNFHIKLKAKNKKVTYGEILYLVSKKDNSPREATFYALSGKPLKHAIFSDFKSIQGINRSTKMTIQDYLQKNKISTMLFSEHKLENFSDSLFNKERLEF
ncbi:MAG: outer membrane lipoprotein-sorting protein [Bacteriovorax sp.]|nr:outer membrane lipoprotein-sorting protein [Bacteriovorax sp.]